ncbi:hypothetical protein B4U80_04819 [Leptotrombidium deliense]|uniref:Uncharacterized protein n=1 Tax=Leptotrombidium deliense TaxID=299467 RepID=A0A443SEQ0_9ACAR|nr:hypothetical protein B4U80_04819 [Leptotrombidium deliense]
MTKLDTLFREHISVLCHREQRIPSKDHDEFTCMPLKLRRTLLRNVRKCASFTSGECCVQDCTRLLSSAVLFIERFRKGAFG